MCEIVSNAITAAHTSETPSPHPQPSKQILHHVDHQGLIEGGCTSTTSLPSTRDKKRRHITKTATVDNAQRGAFATTLYTLKWQLVNPAALFPSDWLITANSLLLNSFVDTFCTFSSEPTKPPTPPTTPSAGGLVPPSPLPPVLCSRGLSPNVPSGMSLPPESRW